MSENSTLPVQVNYKRDEVPAWVREVIETGLAIEQEDARNAGSLGLTEQGTRDMKTPTAKPRL